MIVSYELPLNFSTLKLLDYIEIVYSSEMMQRKIDTAAELTRMGYKVNHQSALSTTFNVIDFSLDMILEYYNLIPVKCMDTTYCVIFEDDGTLTSNVNIKYTTVYLESMLSSSSPKYKTVDGNLIKGNFSRSIYMESHQQCKNISFTDEFGIEGIKNFDINNIDKYTNELLKLTENNDCNFIGLNIEPYLNEDLMINDKDCKTITRMVKKALPYLKFIDKVLNNIGLDLVVADMYFEYNCNLNDIDCVKFSIADRYRSTFNSRIEMKTASTNNKFRILYFKNTYDLTGMRLMGCEDKPIYSSEILGGEYIERVEELKGNGIFVTSPNELCHMIRKGINELHDKFNDIAGKYNKLVKPKQ